MCTTDPLECIGKMSKDKCPQCGRDTTIRPGGIVCEHVFPVKKEEKDDLTYLKAQMQPLPPSPHEPWEGFKPSWDVLKYRWHGYVTHRNKERGESTRCICDTCSLSDTDFITDCMTAARDFGKHEARQEMGKELVEKLEADAKQRDAIAAERIRELQEPNRPDGDKPWFMQDAMQNSRDAVMLRYAARIIRSISGITKE